MFINRPIIRRYIVWATDSVVKLTTNKQISKIKPITHTPIQLTMHSFYFI
jgi:hypothetical protein